MNNLVEVFFFFFLHVCLPCFYNSQFSLLNHIIEKYLLFTILGISGYISVIVPHELASQIVSLLILFLVLCDRRASSNT